MREPYEDPRAARSTAPPSDVRAFLYRYRFTTLAEHRADGRWWRRELRGDFCPPLALTR